MWLIPKPICLSSRAQEAWILDSELLSQALAVSVSVKGSSRQSKSWQREWKKAPSKSLQFLQTYEPSQADSIVAEWLESLEDFHAPTSPSPGSRPDLSRDNTPHCGLNISESFAKCSLSGSLLKMCRQSSLFPQEELYCQGLPKQGSMRNGYLFERPTLALRTPVSGSSSWPPSRAEDAESCGNHPNAMDSLTGATRNWPTPRKSDDIAGGNEVNAAAGKCGNNLLGSANLWQTPATGSFRSRGGNRKDEMGLDQQTRFWTLIETDEERELWPTPDAPGSGGPRNRTSTSIGHGHQRTMLVASETWPTPTRSDYKGSGPTVIRKDGKDRSFDRLDYMTEQAMWPTAQARDYRSVTGREGEQRDNALQNLNVVADTIAKRWPTPTAKIADGSQTHHGSAGGRSHELLLDGMAHAFDTTSLSSPQDQEPLSNGSECSTTIRTSLPPSQRKKLNPLFTAWLMQWPIWWCMKGQMPSAPAAMAVYLSRSRSHCESLLRGLS